MLNAQASIRLFEFRGITVSLHVSWFLVALYEVGKRTSTYSSIGWNLLEYAALFAIVLLHEFGHALACRSVGGRARDILLWPFGGIAYVDPPPRPGATLWSIAAGPLVNVALIPVLLVATWLSTPAGVPQTGDLREWLHALTLINVGLLVFNLMPVYPLDGGQILAALLWFVVGRARGLKATAAFGFAGVAGIIWLAIAGQSIWLVLVAMFLGSQCLLGLRRAEAIRQIEEAPRHVDFACPTCGAAAAAADVWHCANCDTAFDPFAIAGAGTPSEIGIACPLCGVEFAEARCIECGATGSVADWRQAALTRASSAVAATDTVCMPSVAAVATAAVLSVVAVLSLAVAAFTLATARAQARTRSQGEAERNRLWSVDGMAIPGDRVVVLRIPHWYVAFVDELDQTTITSVDIRISPAPSGTPLAVTLLDAGQRGFHRNGRTLLPVAAFFVPAAGQYTVHAAATPSMPRSTLLKIGMPEAIYDGAVVWVSRAISAAAAFTSLLLLAGTVLLIRRYRRQKALFVSAMRRAAPAQT